MAAPAAGGAAVVGEAAITLMAWLVFIIALGSLLVYEATISRLIVALAKGIYNVAIPVRVTTIHPLRPLSDALLGLDHAIKLALSFVVQTSEDVVTFWWSKLTATVAWLGNEIGDLAGDVEAKFEWLLHAHLPRFARYALAPVWAPIKAVQAAIHLVRSVAIPELRHGLDWTRGRVGKLEREASRTRGRLRRAEVYLTAAGAAVLFLTAVKRLGMGWLRCSNVGKAAKRVCRMDLSTLDALLSTTLFIGGAISLERITRELLEQADMVETALRHGFTELRELPPT